ncbi:MAG TPA: rhodanese-like domain-containing protein, partial [Azonexus sp.]|nr:rhodanese-like domain-containing protein [Azonexus sp.]
MSDAVLDLPLPARTTAAFAGEGLAVAALILESARQRAAQDGLPYAGSVTPQDAWVLFTSGEAVLIDVRTAEE